MTVEEAQANQDKKKEYLMILVEHLGEALTEIGIED